MPDYSRDPAAAIQLWRERIGGEGTRMWLDGSLFGFEIRRDDGFGVARHERLSMAICYATLAWKGRLATSGERGAEETG